MCADQQPLSNNQNNITNVFIAEDDELLRELFNQFVGIIPNLNIIGSSGDGAEVIKKCLEINPDLIILDINLPEVNGLEILTILKRKHINAKFLIASGTINFKTVKIATSADVNGILSKSDGLDEIKKGIEAVISGRYYYSSSILDLMPELMDKMK